MKKQLLSVMLLTGALLVGCQGNSVVTNEQEAEKPKEESYFLEIASAIRGEEIEEGLTYNNFLLVGQFDFNSVYSINELFGKQGELIGERQNVQQYRWTNGSGSDYKMVTIIFVDGQVGSKVQNGLK